MGACQSKQTASAVVTQPKPVDVTASKHRGDANGISNEVPAKEAKKVTMKEGAPDVIPASDKSTSSAATSGRPLPSVKSHDNGADSSGYASDTAGAASGYSSGASTPTHSVDGSYHGTTERSQSQNKTLVHSSSVLGLDEMLNSRREEGDLKTNVVHIEVPFGKPIEEVYDGVHTGPVLGSGISGLVRLVTHKATGVKYAVKCLDLGLVETEEGLRQLREEIYIMCQLDHPNIVRLEEVYESHSEIYLVQELCLGGELFDRLDEQPDYHYTEAQCARLVKQMLNAVRYLHSKGIIHRDLKLENFLFSSTSPDSELKMIDFGLSKHFKFGEVQHEAVGTPYTVAPEVIRGSYDERCDIWAIGVITFLLLSGDPPFGGCGGPEPLMAVRSNILRGSFRFEPEDIWGNVSELARSFIRTLLVTDPNKRPTAREAQKHKWLKEWAHREKTEDDNKLNPNVVEALVSFKEYSDMRKLLCEVLSFTLLPEQIKDLRKEFEKMDTDGSGEISLTALKQVLIENAGAGSLGALTEEEVEDIFNAMRVRKSETRIHWHEFIAAGLSQCKVDDRNLRLAFDRLDSDHKGYITFDNVMDLLGNDGAQSEDAMRRMWGDSMKACNCHHARITYDDFLLLMKGQTMEEPEIEPTLIPGAVPRKPLDVVHEVCSVGEGTVTSEEEKHVPEEGDTNFVFLPSGDKVFLRDGGIASFSSKSFDIGSTRRPSMDSVNSDGSLNHVPQPGICRSAPSTPMNMYGRPMADLGESDAQLAIEDGPLCMDDEEMDAMISEAADKSMWLEGSTSNIMTAPPISRGPTLTPPQSPKRGAADYITPMGDRPMFKLSAEKPEMCLRPPHVFIRRRSRSVDDQDNTADTDDDEPEKPLFVADARRAMLLPEHDHKSTEIDEIIKDETKTPLVVNRQLYRAHRQMRLAVLEASKRFEEQQTRRARAILLAQKEAEENPGGDESGHFGAGLVMKHGHTRELSSESVRKLLSQNQKEQQTLVEKANRRGGRGRSRRKKTISDMTSMLSSPPPEELLMDPAPPPPELHQSVSEAITHSPIPDSPPSPSSPSPKPGHLRDATVPGVFRKTTDPFKWGGRYGLLADPLSTIETGGKGSKNVAAPAQTSSNTEMETGIEKKLTPTSSGSRPLLPKNSKSTGSSNWPPPPPL